MKLNDYLKREGAKLVIDPKHSAKPKSNPFGGALGGSLKSPVTNPFDSKPVLPTKNVNPVNKLMNPMQQMIDAANQMVAKLGLPGEMEAIQPAESMNPPMNPR